MLPVCWLGKKVLCLISPSTDNSNVFKTKTEVIFPKRIIAIPDKKTSSNLCIGKPCLYLLIEFFLFFESVLPS